MARTAPSAPTLVLKEESTVPSALRRATKFRAVPFRVVKSPPTKTLPSDCNAKASTVLFAPMDVSKPVSSEPLTLSLASRPRLVPLKLVKKPPTITRPSGWTKTALIVSVAPVPMLKPRSSEPSRLSRASRRTFAPLSTVKLPTTTDLPSRFGNDRLVFKPRPSTMLLPVPKP